ncbi:MAG TPA: 6-carboxytetrahydropterin synthase [Dehalococcoidia bacterium]|nr:6-carboxytetrahydropterin synthase [Dehalococcoidia bacterium]
MSHRITLERNTLRFAAAHFTTFGGECEPLHGHNYAVLVEIEGDLTADSWVFDFRRAKRIVAGICKELDHRFLLPLENPALAVTNRNAEYEIVFGEQRYVVPSSDVAALPIDNSTAERLAEWLCGRIAAELAAIAAGNIRRISVGVEEAPGQAGWFTAELGRAGSQP